MSGWSVRNAYCASGRLDCERVSEILSTTQRRYVRVGIDHCRTGCDLQVSNIVRSPTVPVGMSEGEIVNALPHQRGNVE
jgi:hypothetical protein